MTVGGRYGGKRYLICSLCGCRGPAADSSREARAAGRAEGWSRRYRGNGEVFVCPGCRRG